MSNGTDVSREKLASDLKVVVADAEELLRATAGQMGEKAVVEDNLDRLVARIAVAAQAGDQILVMSNGGFGGIHDKLLVALAGR